MAAQIIPKIASQISSMSRRNFLLNCGCTACAGLVPNLAPNLALAQQAKPKPGKAAGQQVSRRCGTKDPSAPAVRESITVARRAKESTFVLRDIEIPVNFHVLHDGESGKLADARLDHQIAVLNADFSEARVKFFKTTVAYHNQPEWFRVAPASYGLNEVEYEVKSALIRDADRALNIYTAEPEISDLLGWATFPWDCQINPKRDGVVLAHRTIPGDPDFPENLGRTATHEVGHWLGLLHIFQNGCSEPGDGVEDTPFQAEAIFGCPEPQQSCPEKHEADPVANFMNYTDDGCMASFSSDQIRRIQTLTSVFRPRLIQAMSDPVEPMASKQPSQSATTPALNAPPASPAGSINDILNNKAR